MIPRVRGTRDFLDLTLVTFATETIKKHLKKYHFQEIMTPILEPVALFKRSLGLETDVVSKEMFVVSSSSVEKGDEEICLRPEATASVVRAFVENGIQTLPWKVFLSGPMFRYERPQKGRYREFFQCSLEIIGAQSLMHDVQVMTMLDRLFRAEFKLEVYALHINFLGCPADRLTFKELLGIFLDTHAEKLCATCIKRRHSNILRVLDCKNPDCQELYTKAPQLTDSLCTVCATEWQSVQHRLEELAVPFVHMPRLVRGLDYYNKTVFEFVSPLLGAQSTFCGGGRYDHLVEQIGGKEDQPSVGAAIGLDRLVLMLETIKDSLPLPFDPALFVILPLSAEQHPLALQVTDALIRAGLQTELLLDGSVKSMMRKADKHGAKAVIFIGADEQSAGTVKVKLLQTGAESTVKQIDLSSHLKLLK